MLSYNNMSFNYKSKKCRFRLYQNPEKRNKFYQKNKDHAYYKRLEKQADYEVELGKFKEAEELYLKAADERKKHSEKYFPRKDGWKGFNCEGHEARYNCIIGKAWKARESYEEEKKENGENSNSNVYNVWLHCSWREKLPQWRDDLKAKHKRRTLTDYARQLRLNRK